LLPEKEVFSNLSSGPGAAACRRLLLALRAAGRYPEKKGGTRMQDFIKRARLLGVGLFYLGKEKVEETVAELIKKGELTEKEGRALMIELLAKSKAATKDLEGRIQQMMADAQARLHAPLIKEIGELKKRIARLEKEAAAAKARSRKKAGPSAKPGR
jgi:polyhydroxyalkanoate synthesis regulator phasin